MVHCLRCGHRIANQFPRYSPLFCIQCSKAIRKAENQFWDELLPNETRRAVRTLPRGIERDDGHRLYLAVSNMKAVHHGSIEADE
jgi:hypothetical protein